VKIKVLKFGGTSVATQDSRSTAAQKVVSAIEAGYRPVVVVSAIGRKGAPYATDTLISALTEVDPQTAPEPRELDLIMACGEILSSVIFAQTLKCLGQRAMAMTGGQAGIYTDGSYGRARVTRIDPHRVHSAIEAGLIPVVCGFQGIADIPDGSIEGEITTLGRGGSDTTAAALGAALEAEAVEIYTDVDGIKTANPNLVSNAYTLSRASYDEVAEMAHLGATVLHPRAAEIAMRHNIPLWVKSTFSDGEGTEVIAEDISYDRSVTGVTHTGRLVYLQFNLEPVEAEHRVVMKTRIFELMAEYGYNLFMLNTSEAGLGFAVHRGQFSSILHLLDGLVVPTEGAQTYVLQLGPPSREVQAQAKLLSRHGEVRHVCAELAENCTMVSVIGRRYYGIAGVFYTLLSTLYEAGIPVLQTSDSDFSVGCLIPEGDTAKAVSLLHDRFGLSSGA
jgi:aspartate kinase